MKLTKEMLTEMVKEVMQEQMEEMFVIGGGSGKKHSQKLDALVDVKLYVRWDSFRNAIRYNWIAGEPRLVKSVAVDNALDKSDSSYSSPDKNRVLTDGVSSLFNDLLKLYKSQGK